MLRFITVTIVAFIVTIFTVLFVRGSSCEFLANTECGYYLGLPIGYVRYSERPSDNVLNQYLATQDFDVIQDVANRVITISFILDYIFWFYVFYIIAIFVGIILSRRANVPPKKPWEVE